MRRGLLMLAAVCSLFLLANRKAWQGYFEDYDLESLGWNSLLSFNDYTPDLVSPRWRSDFRPIGHLFYHGVEKAAGLRFPAYLGGIELLQLANILLVWWLARRFGFGDVAAAAAALFFAFQPAAFDTWWRPRFVFDVLCGTFGLLSVLLWTYRRLVWSFAALWLAVKSQDAALFVPFALLAYEMTIGERRWKRLIPFFAVTAVFGAQILMKGEDAAWGAGAHWYLPAAALALAVGAALQRRSLSWAVAFFGVFIPATYLDLRGERGGALAAAQENRPYVAALAEFAGAHPDARQFLADGLPARLGRRGIEGTLRYFYRSTDVKVAGSETGVSLQDTRTVLSWDPANKRLDVLSRGADAAYLGMDRATPVWQLEKGWYGRDGAFRWSQPHAVARLARPAGARQLEVVLHLSPEFMREVGVTRLQVLVDGRVIGEREFREAGRPAVRWDVAPSDAGSARVEFRVTPEFHPSNGDTRSLGIPVVAFGFVS